MKWNFATYINTLDNVGFKDNDIEKFGQDPAKSIVREAIQNSCDALDISQNKTCVNVVIKTGSILKNNLQNFAEIESHIKNCKNSENDYSENLEVQRHINAFEQNQYSFLEISDYNTTGMTLQAFENLNQGIFKSTKSFAGAQGSKGVGKAAYYACSYLRTMLVVSKTDNVTRFGGAAKISTHIDPNDKSNRLNYKGLYGDSSPVDLNEIPDRFRRTQNGSSIYIIGLWKFKDLDNDIITEVLRNYWFAILKKQLIVIVNNRVIDSENVEKLINIYFTDYKDYKTGDKQNPRPYLETVLTGKEFKKNIYNIGECSLWLHFNELYKIGAVARFRKTKMLIYKDQDLDYGYSGVFLCNNDEGNKFLKEIENDAHDSWNPKINKDYQESAKITLSAIKDFIRESYASFAGIDVSKQFNVDLIDELFHFEDSSSIKKSSKVIIENKPEIIASQKDRIIKSAKFLPFYRDRKLFYELDIDSLIEKRNQKFEIFIGTDSSKDKINILESSEGIIEGNIITLNVKIGSNKIKTIKLDTPFLVAPSIISKSE